MLNGTEDDAALLRHSLAGNAEAFTALYRRRQGQVYRFALHMSGSGALAEDVTQETFLTLLRDGRGFDASRGSLAAYLAGIARNLVLRAQSRERLQEPDDSLDERISAWSDALGDLLRRESIQAVRSAVLQLPAQYREAVVLCDLEEMSYEEAAAALGCPVGTVRSRLNRGRRLLVDRLFCKETRGTPARCVS
jgi:RNA polymerase sigma-70 factor (ECF subfamily)